jgi:predicted amidohydrolase
LIVSVVLGQVPISWDIDENLATVQSVLDDAHPQEVVVLPEGMISGYDDQLSGLAPLEAEVVDAAVDAVSLLASERDLHVFCGTLMFERGAWSNALLYFSPAGTSGVPQSQSRDPRATLVGGWLSPADFRP